MSMNTCKFLNDRIFFYEKRNIKHKKAVEFAFRDLRKIQYKNRVVLASRLKKNEDDLPF